MQPTFSVATIMVTCGLLYLVQAVVVWQVLNRRADRTPMLLWTLGSMTLGAGLVLFGLRDVVAGWLGYAAASILISLSGFTRAAALLAHIHRPQRWAIHLSIVGAYAVGYVWLWLAGHSQARVIFTLVVWSLGYAYLAWQALQVVRILGLRSARYLAVVEAGAALGLALYTLQMLVGMGPIEALPQTWALMALMALLFVSALWGNLGYLGMVVDQYRLTEQASREAQLVAAARADMAERHAQHLQTLMAERELLAQDRERLLGVMTHEVRQPLHNASGVLQALRQAGTAHTAVPADRWLARVASAEAVLGQVRDVLDNVLQAASLLQRKEPPVMHATELAFLVEFCLLDLPPAQRDRVHVQWRTDLQAAPMAQPLIRLALRNLLRNAFAHGGPDVRVQLNIEERRTPHELVLAVVDDGPGLVAVAPGTEPSPSPATTRQPEGPTRGGLGLQIARQVMALHAGRLTLDQRPEGGLSAALQWPIDGPGAQGPAEGLRP